MSTNPAIQHVLKFFRYDHLPKNLQDISLPFYELAHTLASVLPDGPEVTITLRKLLESKDAAVRSML